MKADRFTSTLQALQRPALQARYDAAYYSQALHRKHWFRDNHRKYELRWRAILRMLRPDSNDTVIDLGCAAGAHALRLAPLVRRVIGVDNSPAAVAMARQRATSIDNVEFVEADATMLPGFAADAFDKAMAIDFVEHIDDAALDAMLAAAWRVLRPAGLLAIYTPCRTHYVERLKARGMLLRQTPGHIAVRTPQEILRHAVRGGWIVADAFFLPSTYPLFGRVDQALAHLPGLGALFRFRYCLALQKRVETA